MEMNVFSRWRKVEIDCDDWTWTRARRATGQASEVAGYAAAIAAGGCQGRSLESMLSAGGMCSGRFRLQSVNYFYLLK